MTIIKIWTKINASIQTVFDISRDIDVHQESASRTNEIAIDGVSSGLINYNETVTWRGKHFGFYLTHKSRITAMNLYDYFVDEMEEGKFKSFRHEHIFYEKNGLTVMKDKIYYEVPYGFFGELFDFLFLKNHMINFILERNKTLKALSENEKQ
ncbi:SRPBCC family protein [Flavobacterium sp. LS1P3]|uniref:SRPBCC family protein n=1 Tax=Flavobacterium sp. LS1P3 TaxID=3401720 RepID=UPI003AB07993